MRPSSHYSSLSRDTEKQAHFTDYENVELKSIEHTTYMVDYEHDIDPENNFLSSINKNCSYYTDKQFNKEIKSDRGLSVIHFKSKRLNANFLNIKEYLHQFRKPFIVIAISETWLNPEKGVDFELEGYEMSYINRRNKKGGGVALDVDKKVLEDMSTTVDNVMECVTIEICMKRTKNVIVSCVYRTLGPNVETFILMMEEMFAKLNQKVMFICGDFNIGLLNPNKHKISDDFPDTLYSMNLYPTITKPNGITSHCATLIDNVFKNNMDKNTVSGLLINDISDHLVFGICNL